MKLITATAVLTAGILFWLLLLPPLAALAEGPTPVALPATAQHDLGEPDGAAYRLFIGLPPGYDPDGKTRYPVAYVLDANVVFPLAVTTHRMFAAFNEASEAIVGVGYPVQSFPTRWPPTGGI